jgi:hypothetical protein
MRKKLPQKLHLTRETLRGLAKPEIQQAAAGRPDQQCPPTEDSSGGFSGAPISYCDTYSGASWCP